jgi:signal recognition particle subunit SEC65
MKVWITKYALTTGIIEKEVDKLGINSVVTKKDKYPSYFYLPDWWPTKESATLRAEQMRNAKIKSLEKQIEKLKKLTFDI